MIDWKRKLLQNFKNLFGFIAFESPEANYDSPVWNRHSLAGLAAGCGSLASPLQLPLPGKWRAAGGGRGRLNLLSAHAQSGPGPAFPGPLSVPGQRCDTLSDSLIGGQTL